MLEGTGRERSQTFLFQAPWAVEQLMALQQEYNFVFRCSYVDLFVSFPRKGSPTF